MSGRGRGRRAKVPEVVVETPVEVGAVTEPQQKIPSKRGAKKKFSVVAVVTHNSIEGSLQPEVRKPLISHLPISSKDIIFHDTPIIYNPIPPTNVEPYDAATDDPFSESVESLMTNSVVQRSEPVVATASNSSAAFEAPVPEYYKKGTLLVQYQGSEETKTIPERVDIACVWCCHRFDTQPIILPVRDQALVPVIDQRDRVHRANNMGLLQLN
jgi:hypothetical protein